MNITPTVDNDEYHSTVDNEYHSTVDNGEYHSYCG